MEELVVSRNQWRRIALPFSAGSFAQRNLIAPFRLWFDLDHCIQPLSGRSSDFNRTVAALCIQMVAKVSTSRPNQICPSGCLQLGDYNSGMHNCGPIYPADLRLYNWGC